MTCPPHGPERQRAGGPPAARSRGGRRMALKQEQRPRAIIITQPLRRFAGPTNAPAAGEVGQTILPLTLVNFAWQRIMRRRSNCGYGRGLSTNATLFLDVLHGRRVCEDPEGQDFIDLDAARAEAVASAQCVVAHGILRNKDVSDRSFLIRDEDEQTVATVPFRDSLPGTLSAGSLSVLAHELNQPLAAASNYLSAAKRLPVVDGSRAMAFVDKAGQQILRAGEIIQRQRDFVSKGKLTRHVTDIRPVLKDALALALIDRSHRGIKVVERVDPEACFVLIDRVQVQQVLVNLIRNAAEAMEGRRRRAITLATAPKEPGLVEVSVADAGSGMAENLAGRLFEPFVTTKPDGMGVGLSICRTIVEAHGGHIRVDAGLEEGTVVRFTLEAGGQQPPLNCRSKPMHVC